MLSRTTRLAVDHLWEVAWANGITNPTACVEVLAVALLVAQVELEPAGEGASSRRSDRRLVAAVAEALEREDPAAIDRSVASLERAARIEAGSPVAAALAADPARGAAVLAAARAVVVGAMSERDGSRPAGTGSGLAGDLLGDVYEHVLNKMAGAGHFGQFRTPSHLVSFVVALLHPRPGELVLDPACGTGSFLIEAARATGSITLRGDEIDPAMVRIAQRNVLLHGLDAAEVLLADGLVETTTATVVLANPPFGGSVRPATSARFSCGSAKTELLFLEQIMRRLAPGGRAGVIVPWGVVANRTRSAAAVRAALLHDHHLDAVIELPAGAFGPYTDSRTAVLVWHAGAPLASGSSRSGPDVFMARVSDDGYTLDDRRRPTGATELDQVAAAFAGWSRGDARMSPPSPSSPDERVAPAMRSVPVTEIEAADGVLTPARFVSARPVVVGATDRLERAVAALAAPLLDLEAVVRELEGWA